MSAAMTSQTVSDLCAGVGREDMAGCVDFADTPTRIADGNDGNNHGHEAIRADKDGLRDVGKERRDAGTDKGPQRNQHSARLEQLFECVYGAPPCCA